ncbi:MAG: sulfate adenylyltransferase subunit CysN, partial [Lentisphaeraceae bacterium]|nr:sulfate adenylyltransferase subunit CysN [Lentisphaeraceae bacterium]
MTNTSTHPNFIQDKAMLRFLTCGSVDDGKSTLIGNLLYNSKKICQDQVEILKRDSIKHGTQGDKIDYALLMDGLASEREQGITIDVAYRFFETPARKFIVADTPGHEQYTRNMVTGASTADLAIILIDASKGLLTQSRRHAFLVSLLRIPHVVVAINKMDLVDYSQEVYDKIVEDFKDFCTKLDIKDLSFIPVSARDGDNVIANSEKTPWYDGRALLPHLENVYVKSDRNHIDFRFPVQHVVRPSADFRGYAGRIDSGSIRPGEEVMVLPSEKRSTVKEVFKFKDSLTEATAGQSIVITLEDEIDISRGDMLIRPNNLPQTSNKLDVTLCWLNEKELDLNTRKRLILKHTTREVNAFVERIDYVIDVNTLHRDYKNKLALNDIARVHITTAQNLHFDNYTNNRLTGSLILIDPLTNETLAAGMIKSAARVSEEQDAKATNITREDFELSRQDFEKLNGHQGSVVWLTGLSGSGKSTIARALLNKLHKMGQRVNSLDGDNVRHGLCSDLGFSEEARSENIRRVGEVAKLFMENGNIAICSFISPLSKDRDFVRSLMPEGRFIEVFIDTDLETCIQRDRKGLYKKALAGEIKGFTGVDAPYEKPEKADICIKTEE